MNLVGIANALSLVVATLGSGTGARIARYPAAQGGEAFNPKIGIVFDGRAVLRDRDEAAEEAKINELEFSFAADVDPFLKAEAYVAVANEDGETIVEIEEAFGRYDNLGKHLSGKFGKFAGAIGRTNRSHTDQLNYLDYPLVVQSHFGEEGLRGVGGSLSYLFPMERYLDLTLEAVVPEDGPLYMGSRASDPVAIAHLRTFFDFSPDLSGQLGATFVNGPTAVNRANVWGLDFTMKFQPGSGRTWMFETEAFWADEVAPGAQRTNGWFAALTTEVRPRLFLTGKYDSTQIPGTAEQLNAWAANLTLKVTEFHHWRLEFQHLNPEFGPSNDRLSLQFQWAIGAHPAHKY